jgi:hypothetical protein
VPQWKIKFRVEGINSFSETIVNASALPTAVELVKAQYGQKVTIYDCREIKENTPSYSRQNYEGTTRSSSGSILWRMLKFPIPGFRPRVPLSLALLTLAAWLWFNRT